MSNEEAILVLQNDAYFLYEDDMPYDRQAYDMAIKALEEKRIKTNADKIRAMTDEELSSFLCSLRSANECYRCPGSEWCTFGHTGMIEWLEKEASE